MLFAEYVVFVFMQLVLFAAVGVGIWCSVEAARFEIQESVKVQGVVVSVVDEVNPWESKRTVSERFNESPEDLGRMFPITSTDDFLSCGEPVGTSFDGMDVRTCTTQKRSSTLHITSWQYPRVIQTVTFRVEGRPETETHELSNYVPFLPTVGTEPVEYPGVLAAGNTVTLHYHPDDPDTLQWTDKDIRGDGPAKKETWTIAAVLVTLIGTVCAVAWFAYFIPEVYDDFKRARRDKNEKK